MSDLVALPLPDGRWIALGKEALAEALDRGANLGLGACPTATKNNSETAAAERWLTSEELQTVTGIHSTTWEAKAKSGEVPCRRVGKALRFKLSEVDAASCARTS